MTKPIFGRQIRLTVGGIAVEQLRVGFTVERTLTKEPNRAEIAVWNLSANTRGAFHRMEDVPVVLEAGYADTGMTLIFSGYMRKASAGLSAAVLG